MEGHPTGNSPEPASQPDAAIVEAITELREHFDELHTRDQRFAQLNQRMEAIESTLELTNGLLEKQVDLMAQLVAQNQNNQNSEPKATKGNKEKSSRRRRAVATVLAGALALAGSAFAVNEVNDTESASAAGGTTTAEKASTTTDASKTSSSETTTDPSKTTTTESKKPESKKPEAKKPQGKPKNDEERKALHKFHLEAKRKANEKRWEAAKEADTVAEAVKALHTSPKTIHEDLKAIFDGKMGAPDTKKVSHLRNAMNSILSEYRAGQVNSEIVRKALAFGWMNSQANAIWAYNALHGKDSDEMPKGKNIEEVRDYLRHAIAHEDSRMLQVGSGVYINHRQKGENVTQAGIFRAHEKGDVYKLVTPEGKRIYYKVDGNNCMNGLMRFVTTQSVPGAPNRTITFLVPPSQPGQPQNPNVPRTPTTTTTTTTTTPKNPRTPRIPETTIPTTTTTTTPGTTPPPPPPPPSTSPEKQATGRGPGGTGKHPGVIGNGQEAVQPVGGSAPSSVEQAPQERPKPVESAPAPQGPAAENPVPANPGPGEGANGNQTTPGKINFGNKPG